MPAADTDTIPPPIKSAMNNAMSFRRQRSRALRNKESVTFQLDGESEEIAPARMFARRKSFNPMHNARADAKAAAQNRVQLCRLDNKETSHVERVPGGLVDGTRNRSRTLMGEFRNGTDDRRRLSMERQNASLPRLGLLEPSVSSAAKLSVNTVPLRVPPHHAALQRYVLSSGVKY